MFQWRGDICCGFRLRGEGGESVLPEGAGVHGIFPPCDTGLLIQ